MSGGLFATPAGRQFLRVAAGRLLSQFGSHITGFSIGVWVYQQTGSLTVFGVLVFLYALPRVLIGPIAGNLTDRFNRKSVLIACELVAGAVVAGLLGVHMLGLLGPWALAGFVFVIASVAVVQTIAFSAATAQLLPEAHRMAGNSIVQVGIALTQIVAPLLAGFLIHRIGLTAVLAVDLVSYSLALLTLAGVKMTAIEGESERAPSTNWAAFKLGWRYIRDRRSLMVLALFMLATNFALSSAEVLFTPLVLSYETPEVLGQLMGLAGVGMLAGGLCAMALSKRPGKARVMLVAQSLAGISLILIGFSHTIWVWALALMLTFAAVAVSAASSQTLWQNGTPLSIQGRVFAVKDMVTTAIVPASYLLAPLLAEHVMTPLLETASWLGALAAEGEGRPMALLFMLLGLSMLALCGVVALGGWLARAEALGRDNASEHEPADDASTLAVEDASGALQAVDS